MVASGGIYIALGSNLGDRERHLRGALAGLAERGDVRVLRCSTFIETAPVGGGPQPMFLNAAAEIDTLLTPRVLLARLQALEALHGRLRLTPGGPRTLDLDLLLYRDVFIREADLVVPHPRMWERDFVLRPLAEICDLTKLEHLRPAA